MPEYSQTCRFPYSREYLFGLASDVESYPDFLPWCKGVSIHERSKFHIIATLFVGVGPIEENFKSKVILNSPKNIKVCYQNGPFKYLYNTWKFEEISSELTEINFFVNFKFKSLILEITMGSFFRQATFQMVKAFESRAAKFYNKDIKKKFFLPTY